MVPLQRGGGVSQVDWVVDVLRASWLFGETAFREKCQSLVACKY